MPEIDWIIIGGLFAGGLAGGAARFGRLCTMSAIEDAIVAHDYRGLKAWGLALAVAVATTQAASYLGMVELTRALYLTPRVHLLASAIGGLMFGLGMTLVGTCGFGLLVRAGGGDLRAAASAIVVGISAIAVTAGLLAPLRLFVLERDELDLAPYGGASITGLLRPIAGPWAAPLLVAAGLLALGAAPFADRRLRQRHRLLIGAVAMGLSITAGWLATSLAVDAMALDRAESLSFVAPVGRALLQFMTSSFHHAGFGVAAMAGVVLASLFVALVRDEIRWEAFDDPTEMRRHIFGGALMGTGGVFAQGCTIGQGMSAASTLAITAPIFVAAVLLGAKLGLVYLIEGRSLWRQGRSQR